MATQDVFVGLKKALLWGSFGLTVSANINASALNTRNDDALVKAIFAMSLKDLLNTEVTTATKSSQKISDAPATIYALSRAQIKNRGYRYLSQLLEDIPEIEIQSRSVGEYNNYLSIRGIAGNEKLVVLLDGYRVNSPTGSPHAIATNYSLVNAERVEVMLGPASALYGADALSGIINIITRQAENSDAQTYAELFISSGSFSTQEASFNGRYHNSEVNLMLTAQFYQTDEDNLPKSYPEEYAWYNNQYINQGLVQVSPILNDPSITLDVGVEPYATPTESHFIHFSGQFGQFDFGFSDIMESHSSVTGLSPEFNLHVKRAIYKTQIQNIFAEHLHQTADKKFSFKTSLSHSTYELNPDSMFVNSFTQYKNGYKYAESSTTKFEEQFTYTMNDTNQIIGGMSHENISALPKSGDLPFAFNPNKPAELQDLYYIGTNVEDVDGNDLTIYQSFFNINYQNSALFIQWQYAFSETLSLTSGARYDENTRYGSTFNPRIAVVYKPSNQVTIKTLFNSGYLAPSPYVSYQHYGAFFPVDDNSELGGDVTGLIGFFWHLPNPNLKPEEIDAKEININWSINSKLSLFLDYYNNSLEQQIVPTVFSQPEDGIFDGFFRDIPISAAEIPINSGTTKSDGYTVKLDYLTDINDFQITSFIAYSASDGSINNNQPLTYMADNTVKAGIEINKEHWSIYLNTLTRSDTRHKPDSNGYIDSSDGYTRVDLFTRYQHQWSGSIDVEYQLKITNLLDKRYFNTTFAQSDGFIASPQNTRKIELAINLRF